MKVIREIATRQLSERERTQILCWLTVLTTVVILAFAERPFTLDVAADASSFFDFRTVYCSTIVARQGQDPYRAEPLGACERGLSHSSGKANPLIIPASTLSGAAIAMFGPLGRLTFAQASGVWLAVLVCTFLFLCYATIQITSCSPALAFASLLPLGLLVPISLGQIASPAVALLLGAAIALRKRAEILASLLCVLAMFEPHLAMPACIAVFVCSFRARFVLFAAAVAYLVISILPIGLDRNVEYVRQVLPLQVLSEARFDDQYSLTYLLTWFGVPVRTSVRVGQLSFSVVLIASGYIAHVIASARFDRAMIIVGPTAASVFLGPYVHVEHLVAAVPLAMWLFMRLPAYRPILSVVLLFTAVPFKLVMQLFRVLPPTVLDARKIASGFDSPAYIGQYTWQRMIDPANTHHVLFLVSKIPTWCCLTACLLAFAALVRRAADIHRHSSTSVS